MGGSKEGSKHDVGAKSDSLKRGTQSLGRAQTLNLKSGESSKGSKAQVFSLSVCFCFSKFSVLQQMF